MAQLSSNRFSLPSIGQKDAGSRQIPVIKTMRPSLFLNQIDIIPNSLKTEGEMTDRSISKPIHTEIDNDSFIENLYHFKLPKLGSQRAQMIQQSLPDLPLVSKESGNDSPTYYQRPSKRTRLFLRRQESKFDVPVLKLQRRRVEFKKSLVVIDLETGVQDRQELNEVKKPVRRITHQKTKSYKKKIE